jgi:hypothetical protein
VNNETFSELDHSRQVTRIRYYIQLILVAYTCLTLGAGHVRAQLAPNQTHGFGNNRLVTFTYLENFDCVDTPTMDLDFNGISAQSDPNEMQTPICQPVTEPTTDPAGNPISIPLISTC